MHNGEKIAVYIRTYKNDIGFLEQCVRLLDKYMEGHDELIIEIPFNQRHLIAHIKSTKTPFKIVSTKVYANDYLGQQIDKITAYRTTDADVILFVDSDTMLAKPTNVSEFFEGNRIVLQYKFYSEYVAPDPDFTAWKTPTENALCVFEVEKEFMCRFPFMFYTSTMRKCVNLIQDVHKKRIENYVMNLRNKTADLAPVFSEFNCLGAYANMFDSDNYFVVHHSKKTDVFKNYWSWTEGGINKFIDEISAL